MIIKITKNNRVCLTTKNASNIYKADGVTFFEVDSVPERDKNTFLFYNPETKEFRIEPRPAIPESVVKAQEKRDAIKKRDAAEKWLADNDWKVNKRMLGEWAETDERWLAYLEGRKRARAQYDDAVALLSNL